MRPRSIRSILLTLPLSALLVSSPCRVLADEPPHTWNSPQHSPAAAGTPSKFKSPMPAITGTTAGGNQSLNPQPLPPKVGTQRLTPGGSVSLNPQPLPPKVGAPGN
jgi:hypothetical protein